MKIIASFFLLTFLLPELLQAQIVNTEKLRLNPTEKKWRGDLDLNFGLKRNKAGQTVNFGGNGRLAYVQNKNKWTLLAGYTLVQFLNVDEPDAAPKNFTNFQYTHLRYNRQISDRLTWEAFVQEQWDEIHEVDIRLLTGTGPRFQFLKTDTGQIFLGILYMYEFENTSANDIKERNRDHRLSSYLSLGFTFGHFTLNHISYFQPNLKQFNDYRINSETAVHFSLAKNLTFHTGFGLIFDTEPPETIRKTRFHLKSGLGLEF